MKRAKSVICRKSFGKYRFKKSRPKVSMPFVVWGMSTCFPLMTSSLPVQKYKISPRRLIFVFFIVNPLLGSKDHSESVWDNETFIKFHIRNNFFFFNFDRRLAVLSWVKSCLTIVRFFFIVAPTTLHCWNQMFPHRLQVIIDLFRKVQRSFPGRDRR